MVTKHENENRPQVDAKSELIFGATGATGGRVKFLSAV